MRKNEQANGPQARTGGHRRRPLQSIVVIVALLTGIVASAAPASSAVDSQKKKGPIVIGNPIPLTGPAANLLKNFGPVSEALIDEANDNGGIHGRKVEQKIADGGTQDATLAGVAFQQYRNDVLVVAASDGPIYAPLAERFKVPTLYTFGTQDTGLHNKYAFPLLTYNSYQAGKLLPEYLLNELNAKDKTIAVIYQSENFLAESHTAFVKAAKKKGLDVVIEQPVDPKQPQCAQEIANVKAENPDIVYLDIQQSALCVLPEAQRQDLKTTFVGTGGTWQFDAFLKLVPGYLEGTTTFAAWPVLADSECGKEYKALVAKYMPDNPAAATDELGYAYFTGFRRVIKLLEEVPASALTSKEKLVKALAKVKNFDDGCEPPVSYGPGDLRRGGTTVSLETVKNNQWVTLDPEWRSKF